MYLCDTSVWLALLISGHEHNTVVRSWVDSVSEPRSLVFCRMTQASLLRLLTNKTVFTSYPHAMLTNAGAWSTYMDLLNDYRIVFRPEPAGLEAAWREFSGRPTASVKLWMDAYLAAYARAADYQLVTTDGGFRQFAGLDHLVLGSAKS